MAQLRKRPLVVFHYRKYRAIGPFIIRVRGIVAQMEKRADLFPDPTHPYVKIKDAIQSLTKAEAKTRTRLIGTVGKRDMKYDKVCRYIEGLKRYVQNLALQRQNVEEALAIIQASGFSVKGVRRKGKVALKALHTGYSGEVKLMARAAGRRAVYNWQMSMDGKRWIDLPDTWRADTLVKKLKSEVLYFFRFRSISKDGESGWSAPINIAIR